MLLVVASCRPLKEEPNASEDPATEVEAADSSKQPNSYSIALIAQATSIKETNPREALALLNKAAEDPAAIPPAHELAGELLYRLGETDTATRLLLNCVAIDPKRVGAHRWLAAIYYDIGAMNDALDHLAEVAELDPKDHRTWYMRGTILSDFERHPEAVQAFKEALSRVPDGPEKANVRIDLAASLLAIRTPQEALDQLNEIESETIQVLELKAECFYSLGNAEGALELLEHFSSRQLSSSAMLLKARILRDRGDLEDSIQLLEKAANQFPFEFEIRSFLMSAYSAAGREELAKLELEAMNRLRDNRLRFTELHHQAMQNNADASIRIELGKLAMDLGKPDLAKSWFRAAASLLPDGPERRQVQDLLADLK